MHEASAMHLHTSAMQVYANSTEPNGTQPSPAQRNQASTTNTTPNATIEASRFVQLRLPSEEKRRIQRIAIAKAYRALAEAGAPSSFTLSECVDIVEKFMFEFYECFGKQPHPFLNSSQFQDVIVRLPSVDDHDLEPENYDILIPKYFEQCYAHCNYHIFHFLSGKIRLNLFYKFCI